MFGVLSVGGSGIVCGRGRLWRHSRRRRLAGTRANEPQSIRYSKMTPNLPGHCNWSKMNSAGPVPVLELRDIGASSPLQDRVRAPGARRAWAGR